MQDFVGLTDLKLLAELPDLEMQDQLAKKARVQVTPQPSIPQPSTPQPSTPQPSNPQPCTTQPLEHNFVYITIPPIYSMCPTLCVDVASPVRVDVELPASLTSQYWSMWSRGRLPEDLG